MRVTSHLYFFVHYSRSAWIALVRQGWQLGGFVEFGKVWISPEMVGDVARDTATHRTTVVRWLKRRTLPASIQRLLNLIYAGDLAEISPAWQGWKLDPRTGKLFPPNGAPPFEPGHLYAMELNYQHISALKIALRETHKSLADLQASIDQDSELVRNFDQTRADSNALA